MWKRIGFYLNRLLQAIRQKKLLKIMKLFVQLMLAISFFVPVYTFVYLMIFICENKREIGIAAIAGVISGTIVTIFSCLVLGVG